MPLKVKYLQTESALIIISDKYMSIEGKIPIHGVIASSDMLVNGTLLGWGLIKGIWKQDFQGEFELKLRRIVQADRSEEMH